MDTLYHYCSNQAFQSIITNRSIWLSSLSLSNDAREGKLIPKIMAEIATEDGLQNHQIERLQSSIRGVEDIVDGLGFCLSEKGDLLSQWRGYADDASGVSIGFSKEYLQQLSSKGIELIEKSTNPKPGFTIQSVRRLPRQADS